ncbi:5'-nucleotidase C-terminal domain-containing protein, partial [Frankia sp. Cpl3]|nr:5'-nucleotidase C-terminal domain-containing protein [Frankia sp. Cpl3]
PDAELQAFLLFAKEEAEQTLSRPIARLPVELEINWEKETPFTSFLAASIRRWTGAEISFANSGLLLAPLQKGDVTGKDLLD